MGSSRVGIVRESTSTIMSAPRARTMQHLRICALAAAILVLTRPVAALDRTLPLLPRTRRRSPRTCRPCVAALPDKAPAKPRRPRRVLVLGKAARLRALVDPAGRAHHRGDGPQDGRLVDHHHLRPGRHQREDPRAVRRALPGQHQRTTSSTIPRMPRSRPRAARRCSTSCAAARAWPASTPPPSLLSGAPVPGAPRIAYGAPGTLAKALLAQGDRDGDGG